MRLALYGRVSTTEQTAENQLLDLRRYAAERDRISFSSFQVSFRGDNNTHTVQYDAGNWKCTCSFFPSHGTCSHTMAMERVLDPMLRPLGGTEQST